MQYLTSGVLAAFIAYIAAWRYDMVEGNFALLLLVASVVTGAYWLAERFYFLPQRQKQADALLRADVQRRAELQKMGISQVDGDVQAAQTAALAQPWWLDWTAGLFPVIVVVFLLRSFLIEPFMIPTGSMIPTLLVRDLILVNKFTYGLRLPVLNTKITDGNKPQRGDVMVFRYPPKPSVDYVKRVVGIPGDTIAYINKRLTINGKEMTVTEARDFFDESESGYTKQFEENLDGRKHKILNNDQRPPFIPGANNFTGREACDYTVQGVTCKVPAGHYFMMGDNRDNSADSRYWGFVPEQNIVGKAVFVWMNTNVFLGDFHNLKRLGTFD